MRRHSRLLVGSCGAAFAIASFVIGLEISATTAAPGAEPAQQSINRTLKSDRLPQVQKSRRNAVNGPFELQAPPVPASLPELPDGCEPLVSPITQSPLAQVPGRCVS
jgi:hypothetical protein